MRHASKADLPTPASPRMTSTALCPARTVATRRSSASHSLRRPSNPRVPAEAMLDRPYCGRRALRREDPDDCAGSAPGASPKLRPVHPDAECEGDDGQEERRPVDPEALAGVARVPDEKGREDDDQHRHDHVADEARRLDPSPIDQ